MVWDVSTHAVAAAEAEGVHLLSEHHEVEDSD
jgi:hypothetical protein